MDVKGVIKSQYRAALAMLEQTIVKCPTALWDAPQPANRFWHVAYHALFYTHLYLQRSEADFTPWANHRDEYQFLGSLPWPPHKEPEIGTPYSQQEVLDYLAFCRNQVETKVDGVDLAAESGFDWLPFNKMELQLYNIRHLQHHTGELAERLGTQADIEIDWVGTRAD